MSGGGKVDERVRLVSRADYSLTSAGGPRPMWGGRDIWRPVLVFQKKKKKKTNEERRLAEKG